MKKLIAGTFLIGLALLGTYLYGTNPTSPETNTVSTAEVEAYVRAHINTLSPESAVLGGTFYVTDIYIDSETQTGTVWYEDGHITLVADFSYIEKSDGTYEINSFALRDH